MSYTIYATASFQKYYDGLDQNEQGWIDQIKKQLEQNVTGKVLRFIWFREKKYLNKRLYYLINELTKKILFISFAPKKDQKEMIKYIIKNMEELLNYLRGLWFEPAYSAMLKILEAGFNLK